MIVLGDLNPKVGSYNILHGLESYNGNDESVDLWSLHHFVIGNILFEH